MRITLVAVGSTGDVAPYVGVAADLVAAGHSVRLATHEIFGPWAQHAGVGFAPLPMDPRAQLTEELAAQIRRGGLRGARAVADAFAPWVRPLMVAIDELADGADLLLVSALAWTGLYSAHLRGIPAIRLHLQPLEPTRGFPPPALAKRSLGPLLNRALGQAAQRAMVAPYLEHVDQLLAHHGGRRWSAREHHRFLDAAAPVLHGFSRHLVPQPRDWPARREIVGFWPAAPAPEWAPDPGLAGFLEAGPAPVYVGFGSTRPARPDQLEALVLDLLRRARQRIVVDGGWADWSVSHDDVYSVNGVDHRWLFPRLAAAVHHAGAGTTGAALLSGVPSVPIPVALDQPFWAGRLYAAGVAARPIPARKLTASALATAIAEVTSSGPVNDRCRALAAASAQEEGLQAVRRAVETAASGIG